MSGTRTSRRKFIGSAVALAPVGMLAGCGGAGGGGSALSLLTGNLIADTRPEPDIWTSAIGQTFRIGAPSGALSATLTAVTPQSPGGDRPDALRQKPLLLDFTLASGFDTVGDEVYWLDRTMGTQSQLFMQRTTDANGRVVLMALLN